MAVGAANALRLTFGGQNERFTLIQIDGVDNSQTITGLPRATPSQEAVREFRILNSTYASEYGRFLAGLVNIITKSGGSSHHGSMYYFGVNDALNARSPLAQHEFRLRQHQFGFSAGGPFSKAFYFANFEGQRRAESNIFSPVVLNNLDAINAIRSRWNLEPEVGDLIKVNNYDTFLLKFDGNLTTNNRLSFRYNLLDSKTLNFLGGGGRAAPASSTRRNAFLRDQAAVLIMISMLSSRSLNEVRFQYGRRSFDFPSVRSEPALEIPNLIIMGKSTSDFDFYRESLFQWTDVFSYLYGEHESRAGINVNLVSDTMDWFVFSPARIIFPGLPGFLGLPPFSAPTPVAIQWTPAVGGDHPGISIKWDAAVPPQYKGLMRFKYQWEHFGFFFQDKWTPRSGISLIYGFRYDFDTFPRRFAERDYDNIQPRLGVALGLGKVTIRGGFGLFHDIKRIPSHWAHALLVTGWHRESPVMRMFPFNRFFGNTAILTLVGPPVSEAFKRLIEVGQFPSSSLGAGFTFQLNRFLRTPYSEQANLGITFELRDDLAVSLDYLYVHGLKIPAGGGNVNAFRTGTGPDGRAIFAGRRDLSYIGVMLLANESRSNYNGGTFSLKKRFSSNFSLDVGYTISKTLSLRDPREWTGSLETQPNNPDNADLEKSLSNQHVGQRLVLTFLGQGPVKRFRGIFRDFKLGAVLTVEGPRFFTIYAGVDANRDGNPSADRPGQLGNNTFKGDRFAELSLRISRGINLTERVKVEVIIEAFNLLNTTNIKDFNTVWGSADLNVPPPAILAFGQPKDVFYPRQIQFALKLIY